MADTIERLYKVTVDGTAAVRQLQQIAASTGAVDSKLQAFGDSLKKAAAQLAGAFAAKEFVAGILRTSEALDQLGKDAQSVGVAVEDLQKLRYAADLSGVAAEQMDKAIASLAVGMADLATGTSDTAKALRAVGAKGGDSPTAALEKIADQFAKMPDGIQKTALAIDLFGKKAGPGMIPLLNGGAEALRKLGDEAERFGGIVSASVIAQAEKFNDNLARLEKASAGAGKQLTVGILPALSGVAEALVNLVGKSDAFQTFGEGLGDVLAFGAKAAALFGQVLATAGTDLAAIAAIVMNPSQAGTLWDAWKKDLQDIEVKTKKVIADIDKGVADARAAMAKPTPAGDPAAAAKALKAAQDAQNAAAEATMRAAEKRRQAEKDAKDAADELRKAYESLRNETADNVNVQKTLNTLYEDTAVKVDAANQKILDQAAANNKAKATIDAQIQAQQDAQLEMQAMIVLAEKGTEAEKELAGAWLAKNLAIKQSAPVIEEATKEQKALGAGFDRFVESLSSGSVTAAQAFRGMTQSIIADLLKIWAKKYIIDALVGLFGGGGTKGGGTVDLGGQRFGNAFNAGAVIPFARGGIVSRPLMLPMALMGEAGPEAVMPLRRTASGDLGVQAGTPQMNVTINNNAGGVDVATRRTGPADLEVIISRTKDAIAADVQRGGNNVSRSFESAYGIGRGAAAAF